MPLFPESLKPAARSAYRAVFRAARTTFHGDPARRYGLQNSVRQTFNSPTLTSSATTSTNSDILGSETAGSDALLQPEHIPASEEELSKRLAEWKEVADVLRKNVVQGVQGDDGAFRLRVTRDTEMGDNASVKVPPKLPTTPFPNRSKRGGGSAAA